MADEAQDDGKYPYFIRSQTVKKNSWECDEAAIIIPEKVGLENISLCEWQMCYSSKGISYTFY